MSDLMALLERLSNEFGPSGRERAVRNLIKGEVAERVDTLEVDAMGNLIAFKAGAGPAPRLKIMLAAHMDEVGFMVSAVGKGGQLSFRTTGLDGRMLLAKRVVIGDDRVPGVISAPVPHLQSVADAKRVLEADDLHIDIGAADEKGANAKVKVGDYGTFATAFTVLSDDPNWPTVRGKAFDDRAGCVALIALLAERYEVDLYGVFTVQEEVGLRGARAAAHRIAPDASFVLEGTICDDIPQPAGDDETHVTRLGAGPAITRMDRSVVAHRSLIRLLQATAAAEGIPVQYKTPGLGGTDSGAIHLIREGIPSVPVAVPCRYIHSPAAILNLNDLKHLVALVGAALRRIGPADLERSEL